MVKKTIQIVATITHQSDQDHLIWAGYAVFGSVEMTQRSVKPGAMQHGGEAFLDLGSQALLLRVVIHTVCPAFVSTAQGKRLLRIGKAFAELAKTCV